MRPVLICDVMRAACVLKAARAGARVALARRLIEEAKRADRHRRWSGSAHPLWGTGTLSGAAERHPRTAASTLDDKEFRSCLRLMLSALDQAEAQETQRVRAGSSSRRLSGMGSPQSSQ